MLSTAFRQVEDVRPWTSVLLVAGLLIGCIGCAPDHAVDGAAEDVGGDAQRPDGSEHAEPSEFLPGLSATVELPSGEPTALVVLVPGGGWIDANPEGWWPLGVDLAARGYAAATITYGTDTTGDHFPRPVDDIRCGIGFAAEHAPDVPIVVVGHSAGAQLVMLAALAPDRSDEACPYQHRAASGVVGLAGLRGSGVLHGGLPPGPRRRRA